MTLTDVSRTLYVSDLDGTLLGADSSISQESVRLLNEAVAAGALFTYATAGSFTSSSRVTEGMHLSIPVVIYGGTIMPTRTTELHDTSSCSTRRWPEVFPRSAVGHWRSSRSGSPSRTGARFRRVRFRLDPIAGAAGYDPVISGHE